MKKAIKSAIMLLAGLLMGPAAASAQDYHPDDVAHEQAVDPNHIFDFVDASLYTNSMSFTAVVQKDGQTVTNALVAVYASDGIRGKNIVHPVQGKAFIAVYGDAPVPLFFKVYTGGQTYVVNQDLMLEPCGAVGIDEDYVITLENPVIPGDVNADGKMDAADAVAIANYIVGTPPATFVKTAADVNNDGKITIADAVAIVNSVL